MSTRRRFPTAIRARVVLAGALALGLFASACTSDDPEPEGSATTVGAPVQGGASSDVAGEDRCTTEEVAVGAEGEAIVELLEREAEERGLQSVLFRVTKGEELIASGAIGDNVTGMPLEQDVHFRNGNVAFAYMGTLLLQMAEAGEVALDDPLSRWLPDVDVPEADTVTLEMLVGNTSGYADYVRDPGFQQAFLGDPFRSFTPDELLAYGFATPPHYPPGTGWSYAHTNYVLLGEALAAAGGQPLADLLVERVIEPLGLPQTRPVDSPLLPEPPLHTFSTERDQIEETTFWNPSWQTAPGSVIATTICDMVASARGIGTGAVLEPASFEAMVADVPLQHQPPPASCPEGVCRQFPPGVHYGLGVLVANGWIFQTPLFAGQGSLHAYLPADDLAVAMVAVTGPESTVGVNHAQAMWGDLAAEITPEHLPGI